jgi:lipopolysaccharide transport system permease protein
MVSEVELSERNGVQPARPEEGQAASRTIIDAAQRWQFVDLGELWRYRELLSVLALRELKVRYRQAVIGAAWAVVQPVTTAVIFGVLFGLLGREPAAGGTPYFVTAYCGLLAWQLLATSATQASASLVSNRQMVTKVYFPRMLLPVASILCALVDAGIAFGVLVCVMAWFGIIPGLAVITLPAFLVLALLTALAAGLWLSALNALYRDIAYVVPFLIQVGFFISPVVYETGAIIPERWRLVYSLNPMVGVLDGFRWALLSKPAPPAAGLLVSVAAMAV